MEPEQTAIPAAAVDLPLARRMLANLTPPEVPIAIERLKSDGYSGAIFFVDVARGPPLVIKVYPRDPSWRMAKEVYVSDLLRRAPVLAPRFSSGVLRPRGR
jgi:hypothetical protein